jgi:hypothetical protein
MTTSPVHRQPPLTASLLSMVTSMGDHQGHSALPTADTRCESVKWMRVDDGRRPNSFRATSDNSTAYAGSFGDYNTANTATATDGSLAQAGRSSRRDAECDQLGAPEDPHPARCAAI